MRLRKLILQLEVMRTRYLKKHGCEPEVWAIEADEDEYSSIQVELCKRVEDGEFGGIIAKKPYLNKRIRTGYPRD